jgi:hypothetical protein
LLRRSGAEAASGALLGGFEALFDGEELGFESGGYVVSYCSEVCGCGYVGVFDGVEGDVLVVGDHELLLAFGDQAFEAADALAAGDEFALGDGDFFLELGVLLDELSLHEGELLEVALEKGEFLLLLLAVRAAQDGVVLLACGVERDFQLDDALAAVLQVAHKGLLDRVEVGELLVHRSTVAGGERLLA